MTDKDEWRHCLGLLEEVASFFRAINRNADVRMNDGWPEVEFQAIKDKVDDYLYPEGLPAPYERIQAIEVGRKEA